MYAKIKLGIFVGHAHFHKEPHYYLYPFTIILFEGGQRGEEGQVAASFKQFNSQQNMNQRVNNFMDADILEHKTKSTHLFCSPHSFCIDAG